MATRDQQQQQQHQQSQNHVQKASEKSVQQLLHFLQLQARLERFPGFSHALGVTSERLLKENFAHHAASQTLTVRYTIDSRLGLEAQEATVALSTYLAIVQEVTSWSVLIDKPKCRRVVGAAGTGGEVGGRRKPSSRSLQSSLEGGRFLTVALEAQWGPAAQQGMEPGAIVDIIATITKDSSTTRGGSGGGGGKLAAKLGVIHAEVRHVQTGGLVCFGSHTRYFSASGGRGGSSSSRSSSDRVGGGPRGTRRASNGSISSSSSDSRRRRGSGLWRGMTGLYSQYFLSDPIPTSYAMSTLFPAKCLHFDTPAQATFEANPKHGTIVGTIHEGCQAVLMELVGRQTALDRLAVPCVELTQIHVNYLAAAPSMNGTTLEIQALGQSVPSSVATTTLHTQSFSLPSSCTLFIQIKRVGEGTIVSEGTLSFKAASSTTMSLSTSALPPLFPSRMTTLMPNAATVPRALASGGGSSHYPTFNKNRVTATALNTNNNNRRRWGSASASGFEPSRQLHLPNYDFTEESVEFGGDSSLMSFETAPSAFYDHRSYATAPTNLGGGGGGGVGHRRNHSKTSWEGLPPEQYSPTASNMSVCSSGGSIRLTMDGSISSSPPVNFSSREHFQPNSIEMRATKAGGIGGEQSARRDDSSEDNPQLRSTMMPNLLVSSSPPAAAAAPPPPPPTLHAINSTSGGVKHYPTTTTAAVGVGASRWRQSRSLGSTSVASLGQDSSGTSSSNERSIPLRRF
jgi:hypothetical protein